MSRTIPMVIVLLAGCGSGGDVRIDGQVTGDAPATLAGERVRVSRVEADGSTTAVAEGEVDASGAFTADVPAREEKLIVEALDAGGHAVAAALLESTGEAGGLVDVAPLDAETTLEAAVFVEMVAGGWSSLEDANPCDLRARIDHRVTAAADGEIQGLASAVAAAQQAEVDAWLAAGVNATQDEAFHAELAAAATLTASLAAGTDAATAGARYLADLRAAAQAMGVDAAHHAEAQARAALALRVVLDAEVRGSAVADAAIVAAAEIEADASGAAVESALVAMHASAGVTGRATAAADDLRARVSAASTVDAAAGAFAAFEAEVVGDGDISSSILGAQLGLDAVSRVTAQLAVDGAVAAAVALDAAVTAGTDDVGGDTEAAVDLVGEAWATYRSAVDGAVAGLGGLSGDADAEATVVACATGSFSAGR